MRNDITLQFPAERYKMYRVFTKWMQSVHMTFTGEWYPDAMQLSYNINKLQNQYPVAKKSELMANWLKILAFCDDSLVRQKQIFQKMVLIKFWQYGLLVS